MKHLLLNQSNGDEPRAVYKETEDRTGYLYQGVWDGETNSFKDENEFDYITLPLKSIVNPNPVLLPTGTTFANVIGSSHDKRHEGASWIDLLVRYAGYDPNNLFCCAQANSFYYSSIQPDTLVPNLTCSGGHIVGGHIVLGRFAREMSQNAPGVFLLPICQHHNIIRVDDISNPEHNTGAGFFMKLNAPHNALILNFYLTLPALEKLVQKSENQNNNEVNE